MIYALAASLFFVALTASAVVVQVRRARAERSATVQRVSHLSPSPTRRWQPPAPTPTAPTAR